jgi:protein-disulfide isomerase
VGDSRAPVTIWEVSDFQCPFCRDFWRDVLPALEREYFRPGKARLIYLNSPIPELHPNARRAHEFAMCAAREKRFWPYHDLLYRHQQEWARLPDPAPYFQGLADSAGVSPRAIGACLESKTMEWLVTAEAEEARRAGISSTPSFVIEGMLIRGTAPLAQWRPILDSIYAAKVRSGQ